MRCFSTLLTTRQSVYLGSGGLSINMACVNRLISCNSPSDVHPTPTANLLSCYRAAVSTYCLIAQPFIWGEHHQEIDYDVGVTGLSCCLSPSWLWAHLSWGASFSFRVCRRSGGTLVPEGLSFRRDSRSDVLFPVLLLHRLLCGNLVIVISLVLVKIWGIEDEVRRMY